MEEEKIKPEDNSYNDNYLDNYDDGLGDNWGDMGGGGESPLSKQADLLKELTNFDPMLKEKFQDWSGYRYDDEKKKYIKFQKPLITIAGTRWIISNLKTYQTKTNIITNLSSRELADIRLDIMSFAWLVFGVKAEEFGVFSSADQYKISQEIQHAAELVLFGAGDGKYTKFLGESVQRTETVNVSPPQPQMRQQQGQGGFFSGMRNKLLGRGG